MQEITLRVPENILVLLLGIMAVYIILKFTVTLYQDYQAGKTPQQMIDDGVTRFVDDIEASPLDEWLEQQIIAGKLDPRIRQVIDFIADATNPATSTTQNEALKKIAKLVHDTFDGDPTT